ncbi:MAG TPA: hypothetical protein VF600_13185 [Abditibacteriaceae bacterium]|jgi:WD40 repeat protein
MLFNRGSKRPWKKNEILLVATPLLVLLIFVWKALYHQWFPRTLNGMHGAIAVLAFTPDGRTLAVASGEHSKYGEVSLWDTSSLEFQPALVGFHDLINSAAFSPDGNTLATGGSFRDNSLRLWDWRRGRILRTISSIGRGGGLCFTPDGKTLITNDGTITLWDVKSGKVKRVLTKSSRAESGIAVSPDGRFLACVQANRYIVTDRKNPKKNYWEGGNIWIFNLQAGRLMQMLNCSVADALAFSPSGQFLAIKSYSLISNGLRSRGLLTLFNMKDCKELWKQPTSTYSGLSFSPNGRWIATEENNYGGSLWNTKGALVKTLKAPPSQRSFLSTPSSIAFSRDGRTLACTDDNNNTVKLWNTSDLN